ncbi:MAG: hypothetical protein JO103_05285 [Candidatus Eremiobacteraeota bacterium]|nr:hypothetical protein [Candidatus Eremiobacteraeota bacterium]
MLTRLFRFASRPRDVYWALRGLGLALSRRRRVRGALGYFQFWFFAWTNSVLKYRNLSARDFDIASVEGAYGPEHILPVEYDQDVKEDIPAAKTKDQLRSTTAQLRSLIEQRFASSGSRSD